MWLEDFFKLIKWTDDDRSREDCFYTKIWTQKKSSEQSKLNAASSQGRWINISSRDILLGDFFLHIHSDTPRPLKACELRDLTLWQPCIAVSSTFIVHIKLYYWNRNLLYLHDDNIFLFCPNVICEKNASFAMSWGSSRLNNLNIFCF